eukprot:6237662-Alexandrium_andersonii.AAC.1
MGSNCPTPEHWHLDAPLDACYCSGLISCTAEACTQGLVIVARSAKSVSLSCAVHELPTTIPLSLCAPRGAKSPATAARPEESCLLYTSDAADDM